MSAKPCVSCHRLIAASFATCTFCNAEQPASAAPISVKETRCATCKRPYSAKLEACPFCAKTASESGRHEALGGGGGGAAAANMPSALGSSPSIVSPVSSGALEPAAAADSDPRRRVVTNAALFGGPILVGAIWGLGKSLYSNRLGGDESSGLAAPCLIAALFVTPAIVTGFVRRQFGPLADVLEDYGPTKVIGFIAIASAIAIVPTALMISGLVESVNAVSLDDRERDVPCKATSVSHRMNKGADMGWYVTYTCDVDGEHVLGTLHQPKQPDYTDGSDIHFIAARGRFGIWVRRSEPLLPGVVPVK